MEARFGALMQEDHTTRRSGLVDVRVGSYRRDQVRNGGVKDNSTDLESFDMLQLPLGGPGDGIRHALWKLTEAKYREACDDFLHKRAVELNYLDEHRALPAFERVKPVVDLDIQTPPPFDVDAWRDFVLRGSKSIQRFPLVRDGHLRVQATNMVRIFASTEGTMIARSQPLRTVELHLWVLSPDGWAVPQTRTWFTTNDDELPDLAEVRHTMNVLYSRSVALASAPMIRSFAGPVLLEPLPAGLMVHEALGHRLEGDRLLAGQEGQTFRDRLGSEVLPVGITVRDDPRMTTFEGRSLVGAFDYDDEGVASREAKLIDDGKLAGFLTSRSPIGKKHKSNGHARSAHHARPMSRMGVTVVEATSDAMTEAQLFQAFLEEIREQEVPFGIRIVEAFGGETSTEAYDFQAFLGEIEVATRVYPDGREELVRGVDFVGTPLNAMRGIVAAGSNRVVDNAWCGAESGYVPVSTICPALLVDELELQSKPMRPMTQYSYPVPWQSNAEPKKKPKKPKKPGTPKKPRKPKKPRGPKLATELSRRGGAVERSERSTPAGIRRGGRAQPRSDAPSSTGKSK